MSQSRLRRWGPRVGLLVGSIGLALLIAELVARAILPTNTYPLMYARSDDPALTVEPRPSQRFEFDGFDVKIPASTISVNASGFRGAREVAAAKAPGVRRLVCIGDSMTYGWGVDDDATYCEQLARQLGPAVEPVNLGVPGYNLAQSVRRLERRGLALAPDLVVFLVNSSDVLPPIDHGDPDSEAAWLVDHSALVRFVMSALKRTDHQSVDEGQGTGDAAPKAGDAQGDPAFRAALDGLEHLGALSLAHRFEVLVLFSSEAREQPDFVDAMDAWGMSYGSVGPLFAGRDAELIIPRDGHPNAAGQAVVATLARELIARRGLLGGAPPLPAWTAAERPPWETVYAPRIPPRAGPALDGGTAVLLVGADQPYPAMDVSVGAAGLDGSEPEHRVHVAAFALDRTEVTNEQYAAFVRAGGPPPLDHEAVPGALRWRDGHPPPGGNNLPVTMVTFDDAAAYCAFVGRRLPSELEWEAAARGNAGRVFPWGAGLPPTADAVAPVGSTRWDHTQDGVSDLYGNASEWVTGPFAAYPGGPTFGSRAFEREVVRIVRGTGFAYRGPPMPSAVRRPYPMHDRAIDRGFRCARSI